jgi:hypothetical protein
MPGQITAKDAFVALGGQDISGDLNTATLTRNAETPDGTTFGSNTRQRLTGGIKDWGLTFSGLFNDNTGAVEQQMDALLGGSAIVGMFPHGSSSASCAGYEGVSVAPDYSVTSPVDGVVSVNATWSGSGDCDRTILLHVLSACSTTGSVASASYDASASTANAVAGYLRITAASGTEPTLDVIIQDSADNSAWSDLITFSQAAAGSAAQRGTAASADRYRRAKITIGGSADVEFTLMTSVG